MANDAPLDKKSTIPAELQRKWKHQQEWMQASGDRVVRGYASTNRSNPFAQPTESGILFDGAIPSSRNKEVYYHVVVPTTGVASCTCPANSQFARGRDCSHITKVKETLAT